MLHFSPAKTASILIALFIGLWLAAPNIMPESWRSAMPSWLPHQTLTLGLDLQGGSYFLLEIDQNAVIKDQITNLRGQARRARAAGSCTLPGGLSVRARRLRRP